MSKIELSQDEVQGVLNTLAEIPLKYSLGLNNLFVGKIQAANQPKEESPEVPKEETLNGDTNNSPSPQGNTNGDSSVSSS